MRYDQASAPPTRRSLGYLLFLASLLLSGCSLSGAVEELGFTATQTPAASPTTFIPAQGVPLFMPQPADLGELDASATVPMGAFDVPSSAELTGTPTLTGTVTETSTVTPTGTLLPTLTFTMTFTPTTTATATGTRPPAPTLSPASTRLPTNTVLPTNTAPPTDTAAPGAPTSTPRPPTATATSTNTSLPTATLLPTATSSSATCQYTGSSAFEATLVSLINDERSARGLTPYIVDPRLTASARVHSTDMACNNFLSHIGSDGSTSGERMLAQGYTYSWHGENIYAGGGSYNAPQQAFTWWMNSEPHRNNLMSPNYIHIGIGYIYGPASSYGGYFTANFGRP
ncbi:MAG: CAP domain-containing protein [Anaerolineales bacterium]|nr:CAP domain-containing protein [Anaerolineales bacterium]